MSEQRKCSATLEVTSIHECTRPAGHPLSASVWPKDAQTHECCGYQWIDTAEGATPDRPIRAEHAENCSWIIMPAPDEEPCDGGCVTGWTGRPDGSER